VINFTFYYWLTKLNSSQNEMFCKNNKIGTKLKFLKGKYGLYRITIN